MLILDDAIQISKNKLLNKTALKIYNSFWISQDFIFANFTFNFEILIFIFLLIFSLKHQLWCQQLNSNYNMKQKFSTKHKLNRRNNIER